MRELMAHSVSVWESDPKAFKYNAVGYLQISPEVMHERSEERRVGKECRSRWSPYH